MKKILNQIKKNNKHLKTEELNDIVSYYEEIITDRLESGESISEIRKTLTYPNSTKHMQEKYRIPLWLKIIFYFLLSPFIIVFYILIFSVFITLYSIIFAFTLTTIVLPISLVLVFIAQVINREIMSNVLVSTGVQMLAFSLVGAITFYVIKYFKIINKGLFNITKSFSRLIGRKNVWKNLNIW